MAVFLRKYGTGTGADVDVPLIKRGVVDFAVGADYTPSAGDCKISIDGGAAANIGTLPTAVAMGNGAYWKFVLSDAELTGKRMIITVADSATKAVEDQSFTIETYGHASAMYKADLSAANLPAAVNSIANDVITTASIDDGALTSAKFTLGTLSGKPEGVLELAARAGIYVVNGSEQTIGPSPNTRTQFAADGTTVLSTQTITNDAEKTTLGPATAP